MIKTTFNVDIYLNAFVEKNPRNLIFLDLKNMNTIADFFVICHGKTNKQVIAIAEHVKLYLKEQNIHPLCHEGFKEGRWVILDYGMVVIHIFHELIRQFYNLEEVWSEAKVFKVAKDGVNHSIIHNNTNNSVLNLP